MRSAKLQNSVQALLETGTSSLSVGISITASAALHIVALAGLTAMIAPDSSVTPKTPKLSPGQSVSTIQTSYSPRDETQSAPNQSVSKPTEEATQNESTRRKSREIETSHSEPPTESRDTKTRMDGDADKLIRKALRRKEHESRTPPGKVVPNARKTGKPSQHASKCDSQPPQVRKRVRAKRSDYPIQARRRGETGRVVGQLEITADGEVNGVELLERAGDGFDELARKVFKQWRFEPARKNCEPVSSDIRVAHTFSLD